MVNNMIKPMSESVDAISDLLQMYEVNVADPDVQQNIINAAVCIDNAYRGFDHEGNRVMDDIGYWMGDGQ